MARRLVVDVLSPLGYRVVLSRDRWRQIVRFKHPALAGRQKQIAECLLRPCVIRASSKDDDVHLYYCNIGPKNHSLCVVAAPAESEEYFVVTA